MYDLIRDAEAAKPLTWWGTAALIAIVIATFTWFV